MENHKVSAVLSLGGSVLLPGVSKGRRLINPILLNTKLIQDICTLFKGLELFEDTDEKIGIVVGGGAPARAYIDETSKITDDRKMLDLVAIEVTRTNAQIMVSAMDRYGLPVNKTIPRTIDEAVGMFSINQFVVMGGTEPGQTTDAVSVKLATCVKAGRVINYSDVDAVYTENPKTNPKARKLHKISHEMLENIILKTAYKPGQSMIFDQLATTLATAHNIELDFVGTIKDLENALMGNRHRGTVVID